MPTTSSTTTQATRGPNKTLLRRVADRLRHIKHPEHYDQSWWAQMTECGTAACVGGFVVIELGYRMKGLRDNGLTLLCHLPGSRTFREIPDVARRAIRLTVDQAAVLFTSDPTGNGGGRVPWPAKYRRRWREDREPKHLIAADLLDAIADGTVKL